MISQFSTRVFRDAAVHTRVCELKFSSVPLMCCEQASVFTYSRPRDFTPYRNSIGAAYSYTDRVAWSISRS